MARHLLLVLALCLPVACGGGFTPAPESISTLTVVVEAPPASTTPDTPQPARPSSACRGRITFVAITGALLVSLLTRYTLIGSGEGPDRTVLLFAGGGVLVGAFIIYNLFIREE